MGRYCVHPLTWIKVFLVLPVFFINTIGCGEYDGEEGGQYDGEDGGEDYGLIPCELIDMKKGPYLQNVGPDSITIMWETGEELPSTIHYGKTSKYSHQISMEENALIHEITITGLDRETLYHYRVVSDNVCSADSTFMTAIKEDTPFDFVVYGDNRSDYETHRSVVEGIIQARPNLVINTGDVVTHGENYEEWGTEFFEPVRGLADNVPLFVAIGNHEDNAHWFYDFFSFPPPENYYSFTYGKSFFIVLDTNAFYFINSDQYDWYEEQLNSEEACEADWIFSFYHHPAYSEGRDQHSQNNLLRPTFVRLEEYYGVDIVFNGHTHAYERGILKGVYRIITGGGGASLYSQKHDIEFIEVFESVHHYVDVRINGRNLSMEARLPDGTVIDSIEISK